MFNRALAVSVLYTLCAASAQDFQLIVAETPVGAGQFQPIERYYIPETGGAEARLSDIPPALTDDPVGVAFRSSLLLFVGNRSGHSGDGSVSTFAFDPNYGDFAPLETITGNSLTDVAQIAFNPVDGELFATNFASGLMSRFVFAADGTAIPHGTLAMPDGERQLGVAIRRADQQLLVSSYDEVRRFNREPDGSYTYLNSFTVPGATLIHFMKFRGDELYVCDIATNGVYRFVFDGDGAPQPNGSVSTPSPIDVAFSPDGQEMYVASHLHGGVSRFLYDNDGDAWSYVTTISTPSLGGIATTSLQPCFADLNDDRQVDLTDLAIILSHFGTTGGAPYSQGNLDGDGDVDLTDLALLLTNFGTICDD